MTLIKNPSHDPSFCLAAEQFILENLTSGDFLMLWRGERSVIVGKNQNVYGRGFHSRMRKALYTDIQAEQRRRNGISRPRKREFLLFLRHGRADGLCAVSYSRSRVSALSRSTGGDGRGVRHHGKREKSQRKTLSPCIGEG